MASLKTNLRTTEDTEATPTRELSRLSIEDKKQRFITFLKKKYKEQYDAVQPIPYIKRRLYCVEKIFVESGVLASVNSEASHRADASWERLNSYRDIFKDHRLKSNRRIIEGEPGYGKSTLTLQLAYDWCNDVPDSPLADVEILILLRLRQLRNVTSIYRAIRLYLVPELKTKDVKDIIESSSLVAFQLDGYDEYPERDKMGDVQSIITLEMFPTFDVTLTTRYLPKKYEKSRTKRVKLTGFDDIARDQYIRKAVCGNDDKAVAKVKRGLKENVILDDLCQVPLFFAMFSHMTHEREDFRKFKSVTEFFTYVMKCFHYHTRNKSEEFNVERYETQFEFNHDELNKIAFEGLSKENQQILWRKEELVKRLGQEFYDHHIRIGVLVEEKVFDVTAGQTPGENIVTRIEVSFYHKIFCEWYASFYVAGIAAKVRDPAELEETLGMMNPFDLQYVYRFACGLNSKAGSNIIEYLSRKQDGDKFAILCVLERKGEFEEIAETVKKLCSNLVNIKRDDSKLLQRSTTQLLQIASSHDIPISNLHLKWSFSTVDGGDIVLQSGLRLPSLSSLEKISINGGGDQELNEDDVIRLLNYVLRSERFTGLWFYHCELPRSIRYEAIPEAAKARNIKVMRPSHASELDLQSTGKWTEITDIEDIRRLCSDVVVINNRTSESVQRSVIDVLVKAASHDIPIFCVHLSRGCFHSVGVDGSIHLNSGISLPILSSLEGMVIKTEEGREIDEDEANGILNHLTRWERLEEVSFYHCLLPSRLSGSCLAVLESKKVTVFWRPYGGDERNYRLNLLSGYWLLAKNTESFFPAKSPGDELTVADYGKEVSAFRTRYREAPWQQGRLASENN